SFTHHPTPHPHTLALHDALPILNFVPRAGSKWWAASMSPMFPSFKRSSKGSPMFLYSLAILTTKLRLDLTKSWYDPSFPATSPIDRKSTRLNSSHVSISYAVFCL